NLGAQDEAGDGVVGLPAVADLARQVGPVAALAPVPFVRLEAGLELAAEQLLEPACHARRLVGPDEAVEDQEAVFMEARNLGGAQLDHEWAARIQNRGATLAEPRAHA